jgi:FtsP/CotA-like multicopper oxidase with cupredoxin domain
MRNLIFIGLFFTNSLFCSGNKVYDTLYINRDTITLYTSLYTYCSFNDSPTFSTVNASLKQSANDTLIVLIINNDTVIHDFTIDGQITTGNIIPVSDSLTIQIHITVDGTYRFYSSINNGHHLGASGILLVGYSGNTSFLWNLFDQDPYFDSLFNSSLVNEIDSTYRPHLFMMNGNCYPDTEMDSSTYLTGMVGDSIIVSIVNSGKMYHSIHFHGYHLKIVSSIPDATPLNREKDTFPMAPGATFTLLLIPDKEGMYPVHDHNLISVTNNGTYPGGMMTMLDIMP